MYKIYQIDTDTLYSDKFNTYDDAVDMAKMFIADDMEYMEHAYSYGIVNEKGVLSAILNQHTLIDLSNVKYPLI